MGEKYKHEDKDASGSSDSSSSDSSEDERKQKREKKSKKEKHSKKHKKHSSKKHKKDRSSKDDDMVAAAKQFLRHQLSGHQPTGVSESKPTAVMAEKAVLLSSSSARKVPEELRVVPDDYFVKAPEFMTWLQEYRQQHFNDLTTEEARSLFSDSFVSEWNSGRLASKYYQGLVQAPAKRTAHQWSFNQGGPASTTGAATSSRNDLRGMSAYIADNRDREMEARQLDRAGRKREAGLHKDYLDEILPKATGRDALIEKKVARREESKARESSPDRAYLPGGGDIMGEDDSFAAAKAREARREESFRNRSLLKKEELSQRLSEAQAAEDAKMAGFRALLAQGPITIAKRQQ
ncbi:hypothetical protein CEUSTIGMA_g6688.t1 [Chlamydomonas eustigma]|uniref:Uncharacterized protein n=1 Tax=Chlamydomonas eustigma TaxID=1157962 RepID=A0A250X838_9CHLO|nr:hypothetical protein CEUSTIGMA_g6688.t1 [Chlamydomonas eustigma]|eukprot:GAX79248.1 hypothetical protein CEUSTIGMA_g6688.t1 [Chlamydomonas eustigma]